MPVKKAERTNRKNDILYSHKLEIMEKKKKRKRRNKLKHPGRMPKKVKKLKSTAVEKDNPFIVNEIISLPAVSVFANSRSFNAEHQRILYTASMEKLYQTVHDLLPSPKSNGFARSKSRKIKLKGPHGIGKSFHLFSLFRRLRQERKDLRILYIQDSKELVKNMDDLALLLKEVFSEDEEILEIINSQPLSVKSVFKSIFELFGKKFIIIMDQVDALYLEKSKAYCEELNSQLAYHSYHCKEKREIFASLFGLEDDVTCLISFSGRNEFSDHVEDFILLHICIAFSEAEFIKFSVEFDFLKKDEITDELLRDVNFYTGSIGNQ